MIFRLESSLLSVSKLNPWIVMHSDPISEIHGHRLPKPQCSADKFANLDYLFSEKPQVATGLTATEWRPNRQKMEGRANS